MNNRAKAAPKFRSSIASRMATKMPITSKYMGNTVAPTAMATGKAPLVAKGGVPSVKSVATRNMGGNSGFARSKNQ